MILLVTFFCFPLSVFFSDFIFILHWSPVELVAGACRTLRFRGNPVEDHCSDGINIAYDAGRSVFCEKPISQEETGIRACYEAAEKANRALFCSFNR